MSIQSTTSHRHNIQVCIYTITPQKHVVISLLKIEKHAGQLYAELLTAKFQNE